MGRPPRSFTPYLIYHLTAHGVDDRPTFVDDVDRQVEHNAVAAGMVDAVTDWPWSTHAGCDLHRALRPYLQGV